MSGAIPRSIPARRPRALATVRVPLRGGAVGTEPFPLRPVPAGDVVWLASGVAAETGADPPPIAIAIDAGTGEPRIPLRAPDGRSAPPDQVSLPAVSPDGTLAMLLRRGNRVSLLLADARTGAAREIEPARPQLPAAEDAELAPPVVTPDGGWIVGFGLRQTDPNGLASRRIECLGSGGGPVWSEDGARLLGMARGMVLTRRSDDRIDNLVGLRVSSGEAVWVLGAGRASHVELFGGGLVLLVYRERRAKERERRRDGFVRLRAERIAEDPIGARRVAWADELRRYHRQLGRYPGAPVRGYDVVTAIPRFRFELPGDIVPPLSGGPHLVCLAGVDEEGVGAVFRHAAADGAPLGRRGFHVEDVFHDAPPAASPGIPRLIAVDHTHLLWVDGGRDLVCEVLADPGREVWRAPLTPGRDPRARAIVATDGRIFVRDEETLEIWAAENE